MVEPSGGRAFIHRVRVYYEDTDAAGIVYYANYLRYAERGRTEVLRALGIEQRDFAEKAGVVFAVRRLQADFARPARLDDELAVVTRTTEIGGAALTMEQVIRRGDDALVTLTVDICAVAVAGPRAGRPVRIPQEIVSLLQPQG
ncbi:MAG TPA: tol-pal system-associated acyl-CoA thioesterase [Alphaproteobacteria bacterium]|nr:tol-pal system-associated acyl-CoA thioesterase [Alphaproteobacteria bacterium]